MPVEFRRRGLKAVRPGVEGVEGRQLLSTVPVVPDIAMISATTADSKGVTFRYEVKGAPVDRPTLFRVERAASSAPDATATPLASVTFTPAGQPGTTLDGAGRPALAEGTHTVTVPLPEGLAVDPKHPYVRVLANADGVVAESNPADNAAGFQKHTVGVITHGGVQPEEWKAGPPWQRRMAAGLVAQGYDAVIPYNWVAQSNTPGAAAWQSRRLSALVRQAVSEFPAGDPVDLHFIGHSEGAVVNSQTLLRMNAAGLPATVEAGTIKMTMLDPHAATNELVGKQYSVSSGILGFIARQEINKFQANAKDPLVVVPSNVDQAEVFYQRTPVSDSGGSNNGVYNLWGQVPVIGKADHYNLTAPGISHSGKFGVQDWYRLNVVPTLGDGGRPIAESAISGTRLDVQPGAISAQGRGRGDSTSVTYAGHAAPGSNVRLVVDSDRTGGATSAGRTTADDQGNWRITTRPLPHGKYRVHAVSNVPPEVTGHATPLKPTAWLGPIIL